MSGLEAREVQRRAMRPRATVTGRPPQRTLLSPVDLERIRNEAQGGVTSIETTLALLDQVAIRDEAIRAFAARAAEDGSDAHRAGAQEAADAVSADPPIHVRLEFDLATDHIRVANLPTFLAALREWSVDEIAALADVAQATVTYRGESESWETRTP